MEKYLEKEYIIKALKFYNVKNQEDVLKTLDIINNDSSLQEIIKKFHILLFVNKTDKYKKIKQFDNNVKNRKTFNKIILLTGYNTHLQKIINRKFDLYQIERQIINISNILNEQEPSFDQVEWAARFMRGNIIEIGPLQYEIMHEIPSYLKQYQDKQLVKIHIPKNSNLKSIYVEDSLNKADNVIEKYFKEININNIIYYTESWLLSPELLYILSDNSNILNFQKYFDLVALKENTKDFNRFVFQNDSRKNTSLQINLQKYLKLNKPLHIGIGFLKNYQLSNKII